MLGLNADRVLDEVTPVPVGLETAHQAEGRTLAEEVGRIRNDSGNSDLRILADAILHLRALVYASPI